MHLPQPRYGARDCRGAGGGATGGLREYRFRHPIGAVYRWRGKIEKDEESLLVIKTRQERIPELQEAIRARHPHEVPEAISLPIDAGSPAYLAWLDAEMGVKPS
uniref:CutA1 divalent ion tolerance protein n=1 Tax=Candidatus Kentrum sp. TC TaxID=2126339 RepID=A0A450ZHI1_9GAMM|nr:MAG: CutA1 divalent ion tolerance protein [Candidatus Kentron sp. TC]